MKDNFSDFLAARRSVRPGNHVSPRKAIASIPDGARVFLSPGSGTPMGLVETLNNERHGFESLTIVSSYILTDLPLHSHPGTPFRFTTLQATSFVRPLIESGYCTVLPCRYSDFSRLFLPEGPFPVDVALVQVSPPGPEGLYSLGTSVGSTIDIVHAAPIVIAQVNPQVPYTFGAGELPGDAFDYLVDIETALIETRFSSPDNVASDIAKYAAGEIMNGSTLQFGVGTIPEAVLTALGDHKDLGVHGGLLSSASASLFENGIINNSAKNFDRDSLVVAEVLGERDLFDWVHRNRHVCLAPASYTHGLPVLARCHRFTAINSSIEIALDGTLNAEIGNGKIISGPGGQPDFAIAASIAPQGRSLIVFPSTAAQGARTRIVCQIDPGATVTLPRYLADRVITEYGVARLRGLTLPERAVALRNVAHPQFRSHLTYAA